MKDFVKLLLWSWVICLQVHGNFHPGPSYGAAALRGAEETLVESENDASDVQRHEGWPEAKQNDLMSSRTGLFCYTCSLLSCAICSGLVVGGLPAGLMVLLEQLFPGSVDWGSCERDGLT